MLDITLCVNQFEASTFPFQAAPLEFKLLRKTLLKCPIQVQDLMVISFRKVKSATVRDKTLLFQMRNLTSPVQILHPSKAKFNFPTPWAWTMGKSLWVAWGGMLKLWIDRCIIWCFLLVWLLLGIQLCPWVSGLIQGSCWKSAEFCRSCTKITFKMKGN